MNKNKQIMDERFHKNTKGKYLPEERIIEVKSKKK